MFWLRWATQATTCVLVRVAPRANLAGLVQRLKGASAYQANISFRLPHRMRWQSGYWAESVAPHDAELLAAYLYAQRNHHDESHPAEWWQMSESSPWEPAPGGL